MIGQFTHILLTLIFAGIPLAITFLKFRKIILKNIKTIFSVLLVTLIYSLIVDNIALLMGIWNYTDGLFTGIKVPFMPLDDLIFIIFVQLLISSITIVMIEKKTRKSG